MNTQIVDLQEWPLYTVDYEESPYFVNVYGYKVQLPKPPPDHEIINYGLPLEEQVFRKTLIPQNINFWEFEDQERFITREYHRRKNGIWIFIKGKRYYIPGVFYYFLNYWKLKSGTPVIFRMTDLHFFLMWMHVMRDPLCLGLIDFKCRQIGDTEKVLCIIYEMSTRFKNIKCAMQSLNETHIKKSYMRMVFAHDKMLWFMKPQNKGSDNPQAGLEFKYPGSLNTNKKSKEQFKKQATATVSEAALLYKFDALESEIQYGPSDAYYFDGQTWNLYYMDEFGKMERMNPIEALGVITPAMESRILDRLVGKVIMTSTVEELKAGLSLKWAKELWRDSNPDDLMDNGRTQNGLYRIFRSALDRAPVDKFGFPKKKEEEAIIKAKMKSFMKSRNIKGLIQYKRKNPITIKDVFLSAQNESQFHIENLVAREMYLEGLRIPKGQYGNLKWKDGVRDSEVIWEPCDNGRWYITRHPGDYGLDSNAMVDHTLANKPANIREFGMGVDPYDQATIIEGEVSKGGMVVRRRFDPLYDGDKFNEQGKPYLGGIAWETGKVVCDYLHRWQNPNDFYEDVILTAVYFGCEFLFEKNKGGGLESYITTRGYELYFQEQPDITRSKQAIGKRLVGITATANTVNYAFELLQTETCDYPNTINHPRYLGQLLSMNMDNRTEHDIGMAGGWAHVACQRLVPKQKTEEERKSIRHYTENEV